MKKLPMVVALLLVFALAQPLFSYSLCYAEDPIPSPTDPVDDPEEGKAEEIGIEQPILPFA